jgi:hypothetical protein
MHEEVALVCLESNLGLTATCLKHCYNISAARASTQDFHTHKFPCANTPDSPAQHVPLFCSAHGSLYCAEQADCLW